MKSEMGQYSRNKMQDKVRSQWEPSNRRMRRRWYEQDMTLAQWFVVFGIATCFVSLVVHYACR